MEQDERKRKRDEPWYRRMVAIFIGIGAVASAFVAIDQAKNLVFDPDDDPIHEHASIDDLKQLRVQTLSDFTDGRDHIDLPLGETGDGGSRLAVEPVAFVVTRSNADLKADATPSVTSPDVTTPPTTSPSTDETAPPSPELRPLLPRPQRHHLASRMRRRKNSTPRA